VKKPIVAALALLTSLLTGNPACGSGNPPQRNVPLTKERQDHHVAVARSWVSRLWTTNDVHCGKVTWQNMRNPVWTRHCGVWTNEFLQSTVSVRKMPSSERYLGEPVSVEFDIAVAHRSNKCSFEILDDGSDHIIHVRNDFYMRDNIPYKYGDWTPIHTNEQQARQKAAEYAAMFGVRDLLDETRYELRSFGLTDGSWAFDFTPIVNGYPTLYAISAQVADLPGYPLGEWFSGLHQIPTNLPTKVALTADEGKEKAVEYVKAYFPLKSLIPKLAFHSNRLEYISPNYNY
jgi:hypothetical protein